MSGIDANIDGPQDKINKCQTKDKEKPPPKPAKVEPEFGSFVLGMMDHLSKKISKCFGCEGKLKKNKQPHNLVIVSFAKRPYFNKSNQQWHSKPGNIYFHLNPKCVQEFDGDFSPTQVQVPDDLMPHLNQEHIHFLQQKLQINLNKVNG